MNTNTAERIFVATSLDPQVLRACSSILKRESTDTSTLQAARIVLDKATERLRAYALELAAQHYYTRAREVITLMNDFELDTTGLIKPTTKP